MMRVSKRFGNTTVFAEGESHFDIFSQLATLQEVFCEEKCGKCGSPDLRFVIRRVDNGKKAPFEYPELRCNNHTCRAKLTFGQQEGGQLFPIRFERNEGEYVKDENGRYVPRGKFGWVIYNKETGKEE